MSENAFQDLLPALEGMSEDQVEHHPTLPVGIAIQEASDLWAWCQPEIDALVGVGVDRALIDSLPKRIGAARHAQSAWNAARFVQEDARRAWEQASPGAYALRDDLLQALRFAFRRAPDLLERVRAISEGEGDADLLQDLSDLALLGRHNRPLLDAIGLDPALLDQSAADADRLSHQLGMSRGEGAGVPESKRLRDRAYSYLQQAVTEIREAGRYLHRKNPSRAVGYASDFSRQRNRQARRREQTQLAGGDAVPAGGGAGGADDGLTA